MKRPLRPEEARLWAVVAQTVRPHPGRAAPTVSAPPPAPAPAVAKAPPGKRVKPPTASTAPPPPPVKAAAPPRPVAEPERIEPNRKRRISREREALGGRLDLHGMTQDRARQALHGFIARAHDDGARAVLIITGKGVQGDGVLKRRAPEWLAAPHLSHIVAGISDAARHHGGAGALYVALKRKPRG